MLQVGDLVYLDMEDRMGIILEVSHETKLAMPLVDIRVWWCGFGGNLYDGYVSWCLGEAITVVSPAAKKK